MGYRLNCEVSGEENRKGVSIAAALFDEDIDSPDC
jgi:hypothetical protein